MHPLVTVILILIVSASSEALASHEGILEVAQPIEVQSGTSGICVAMVPYVGHSVGWQPSQLIMLTVAPNIIWSDKRPENRNLASQAGVKFVQGWDTGPDKGWGTEFLSDTLSVTVDVAELTQPHNFRISEVVVATLWCGLVNAKQLWPRIRFVEYVFSGPSEFSKYAAIYELESVRSPERTRYSLDYKDKLRARRVHRSTAGNKD